MKHLAESLRMVRYPSGSLCGGCPSLVGLKGKPRGERKSSLGGSDSYLKIPQILVIPSHPLTRTRLLSFFVGLATH